MQTLKSVFGVIGALVPVVYCGGLLYYFLDLSGSANDVVANGLGPTVLGLGIVGLLFCIPLIVKVVRILIAPHSPVSSGRSGSDTSTPTGESGFDADEVIARHMARRSAEAGAGLPTVPLAHEGDGPAARPTFGRKIT
jgi:hypothetical protein